MVPGCKNQPANLTRSQETMRLQRLLCGFSLLTVAGSLTLTAKASDDEDNIASLKYSYKSVSLADRWTELQQQSRNSSPDRGFRELLKQEELAVSVREKSSVRKDVLFLVKMFGLALAVLATAGALKGEPLYVTLSALMSDIRMASTKALLLKVAFALYQQLRHRSRQEYQAIVLWIVTTFGKLDLLSYLGDTVLPILLGTLRQLITTELWNRFFNAIFLAVSSVSGGWDYWMPQVSNSGLAGQLVKRGFRRMFQSTLQRHLKDAVNTICDHVRSTLQAQLFEFENLHNEKPAGK